MTLVVARIDGHRVAIAADTLLTEHGKALPFQSGVVKSCMLPGDICVSFSNSPASAEIAFREFTTRYPGGANFAEVTDFFERSSRHSGNDYLVAFANPARLLKIADGKRLQSLSKTLWIGDQAAYSRFREQEAEHHRRPERGRAVNAVLFADELARSPASDLFSTMRYLAVGRSVSSVGGFVSLVSNRGNGFRFSVYSDMLFDWPEGKSDDYLFNPKDPINLGASRENANFSLAQISSGYMGVNLVGFYYTKARKLFFFHGMDNGLATNCTVFDDLPATEIQMTLNNFVRADLKWLVMITSPQKSDPRHDTSDIKNPGVQLGFFVEANTLPRS
jgi:hypothetical protein